MFLSTGRQARLSKTGSNTCCLSHEGTLVSDSVSHWKNALEVDKCIRKIGDYYVGEFLENAYHGYGEYHNIFGKVKKGYWKNGVFVSGRFGK